MGRCIVDVILQTHANWTLARVVLKNGVSMNTLEDCRRGDLRNLGAGPDTEWFGSSGVLDVAINCLDLPADDARNI